MPEKHGVDLWLNNPVPPMEASGTSGMKAALNGVPHLSILDGWWIERFNGRNGWGFPGSGDDRDAEAIYSLLEAEIIPLYYRMDDDGIPHKWVKVMKEAIKNAGARISAKNGKRVCDKFYHKALKSAGSGMAS